MSKTRILEQLRDVRNTLRAAYDGDLDIMTAVEHVADDLRVASPTTRFPDHLLANIERKMRNANVDPIGVYFAIRKEMRS